MTRTAFHLTHDSLFKQMSLEEVATIFDLPDLKLAFSEYIYYYNLHGDTPHTIGGQQLTSDTSNIPFKSVQVWCHMQIQCQAFHYPHDKLPAQTLNCSPPSSDWPHGHYDNVLLNTALQSEWPKSHLTGR